MIDMTTDKINVASTIKDKAKINTQIPEFLTITMIRGLTIIVEEGSLINKITEITKIIMIVMKSSLTICNSMMIERKFTSLTKEKAKIITTTTTRREVINSQTE